MSKTTLRTMWRWIIFDLVLLHSLHLIYHRVTVQVILLTQIKFKFKRRTYERIKKLITIYINFSDIFAILIMLSFFGNPISKGVVKVKAYNYLKENCSDYEAKSIEIVYDLVNSSYLVNVYNSGSEEIEFTLVYNYFGCFKKKVSRNIS